MHYPPSKTKIEKYSRRLQRNGFVVLKYSEFTTSIDLLQTQFDEALNNFPEYVPNPTHYVGGGFGALGNASSFHNSFVRTLRQRAMSAVFPVFKEIAQPGDKFTQIIDRMMVRFPGQSPTAESWHRDVSPAPAGTRVFGGWINLDNQNQYFSCVKGTHLLPPDSIGFAKLGKEQSAHYTSLRKNLKKGLPSGDVVQVTIPPGGILIFSENIIHEVFPSKTKYKMRRLFLGWSLGQTIHASRDLPRQLREQDVVTLKSGQDPRMWPKLYWVNYPHKIQELSKNFKEEHIQQKTVLSGKRKHETFDIIPPVMHSKKIKYAPYTTHEHNMYFPHTQWNTLHPNGKYYIQIKL
jgi:hypothetical protein